MFSRNPNRAASIGTRANANLAGSQVTPQQLHDMLKHANQRISQLASRLQGAENGSSIQLGSSGITNTAAAQHLTNASTTEASAGMVTVNAGMSKYSGVVKCDTIIASSVVGSSYTPAAAI
jgi:hypothetical protein